MLSRRFNNSVLIVAFATFVAFMGIGLVDPLLPLIAKEMGASAYDVEWLFTSYILIMDVTMLVAGWLSTIFGNKKTLVLGLSTVVIFSTLSGLSQNIPMFAVFRGGWGFGNALFTTTALTLIVGSSLNGNILSSITLYEAALGLGISSGPLLGGYLGSYSWRFPFFGTATLMAIGLILTLTSIREPALKERKRNPKDILMALKDKGVRINALIALGYNFGYFTILAYSPLTISNISTLGLGIVYFSWGILVAISSVLIFNFVANRFSMVKTLLISFILFDILLFLLFFSNTIFRELLIIATGIVCGLANAILTSNAIAISPFSRSVSSASYNLLRWSGAAIAPVLDGFIADNYGILLPYAVSAFIQVIVIILLLYHLNFLERVVNKSN